jgi:cyclase
VHVSGGSKPTDKELYTWAAEVEGRGAGEILFTSMNHDGTKNGFAVAALKELSIQRNIPIIASGGAGNMEHFRDVFTEGMADAGLAASIFHFKEIQIQDLKNYLAGHQIPIRLN